jgi:hypothetical protein
MDRAERKACLPFWRGGHAQVIQPEQQHYGSTSMSYMNATGLSPSIVRESNLNLFTFAARCMALGDTGSLRRVGLTPQDLPALRHLSLSQLLAISERGSDLYSYLRGAHSENVHVELERILMHEGAPRTLMMSLFRMSTRRYSAERVRLGVEGPRGRPITTRIDCATEQNIWRLWVTLADDDNNRRLRRADDWLLIAREMPGHLRTAWSLIQRWARDESAQAAFAGDRARLSQEERLQVEHALRRKHNLELQ